MKKKKVIVTLYI